MPYMPPAESLAYNGDHLSATQMATMNPMPNATHHHFVTTAGPVNGQPAQMDLTPIGQSQEASSVPPSHTSTSALVTQSDTVDAQTLYTMQIPSHGYPDNSARKRKRDVYASNDGNVNEWGTYQAAETHRFEDEDHNLFNLNLPPDQQMAQAVKQQPYAPDPTFQNFALQDQWATAASTTAQPPRTAYQFSGEQPVSTIGSVVTLGAPAPVSYALDGQYTHLYEMSTTNYPPQQMNLPSMNTFRPNMVAQGFAVNNQTPPVSSPGWNQQSGAPLPPQTVTALPGQQTFQENAVS